MYCLLINITKIKKALKMKKFLILCFSLFSCISWGTLTNDHDTDESTQQTRRKICLRDYKSLTQELSDISIHFHDIRLPIESH